MHASWPCTFMMGIVVISLVPGLIAKLFLLYCSLMVMLCNRQKITENEVKQPHYFSVLDSREMRN